MISSTVLKKEGASFRKQSSSSIIPIIHWSPEFYEDLLNFSCSGLIILFHTLRLSCLNTSLSFPDISGDLINDIVCLFLVKQYCNYFIPLYKGLMKPHLHFWGQCMQKPMLSFHYILLSREFSSVLCQQGNVTFLCSLLWKKVLLSLRNKWLNNLNVSQGSGLPDYSWRDIYMLCLVLFGCFF